MLVTVEATGRLVGGLANPCEKFLFRSRSILIRFLLACRRERRVAGLSKMGLRAIFSRFEQELKIWLRSSNFSLRALNAFFTSAPAAVVILDSRLRVVKANVTMADMIGTPLTAMIGQTTRDVDPWLADEIEPILLRVSTLGKAVLNFRVTGETRKSPGVMRQWVASAFPIYPDTKGLWCVGAIIVEVTEEAHFEKLRKSEALLSEAEQIGHLGCWENDLATGECVWSANPYRLLGVDPAKKKLVEELFWELIHPDDREAARTAVEGGMKDAREYEYQSRFILPEGHERTFFTRAKAVMGPTITS
jgi:PAS domain-containing protein